MGWTRARLAKVGFRVLEVASSRVMQVEQGFSSFFAKIFEDFSNYRSASSMLCFEKSSKLAKKMKKTLVQFAKFVFSSTHFSVRLIGSSQNWKIEMHHLKKID